MPELAGPCDCRKPAPGMLLDAAAASSDIDLGASWMIGDTDGDVAGRAGGGLPDGPDRARRQRPQAHSGRCSPDAIVADLAGRGGRYFSARKRVN